MHLPEQVIRTIVTQILSVAEPVQIVLFGSAATDTMTSDSDIDLLILKKPDPNSRTESIRIRRALRDLPFPVDVIVMDPERFRETQHIIGTLAYPAHKYGRILYEAA